MNPDEKTVAVRLVTAETPNAGNNEMLCPVCKVAPRARDRHGELLPGCCRAHSGEIVRRHQGPAGLIFICSDPESGHRYAVLAHEFRRGGHEVAKDVLGWFGGNADPEEDLKFTAAREAFEETLGIFGSADALLGMLYEENACVPVTPRTFALSLGELTLAQRNNLACEFQRLRKHASSRCQLEVVSIRFVPLLSLGCFLSEKAGAGIQVIGDEAGGQFWLRTEFANSCRAELANPESELSKLCSGMGSLTHLRKIPLSVSPQSLPHGAPLRAFQPNTTICPFFVQGWCKFGPACPRWHPTL